MKVGIFESYHFEGSYPVIKLFDIPGNQLVIFTTAATHQRFAHLFKDELNRYEWVITDSSNRWRFFLNMYRQIKKRKLDFLYINTITDNHVLYALVLALLRLPRKSLTLHDINCMLNSKWSWQPRQLLHHLGKKLLVPGFKEFNVVAETMLPYLRKQTRGRKLLHNMPGAVFDTPQTHLTITDHIHLVVPGTVDKRRRDYEPVFVLLQLAEEHQLPLQVTLLGGYLDEYGVKILEQAKAFKTKHTVLRFYDTDTVHQDEFDIQMNAAHFVFTPSVIDTAICFAIPEIYGITKSSGNIFDVIKHAKPFITPVTLSLAEPLIPCSFRYQGVPEIFTFLQELWDNKESYAWWETQALKGALEYTPEKVRRRNTALFPTYQ